MSGKTGKRMLVATIILGLLVWLTGAYNVLAATPHAGNPGGNCDGYNGPTKVDTSDGTIVLPTGTIFCIHASNTNTGTLVADGASSLADYITSTIVNRGGQVPNVSNYVTYGGAPSTPPSDSPSAEPSVTPSDAPSTAPSTSTLPSSSASPDASTGAPSDDPTLPPTDTAAGIPVSPSGFGFVLIVLVAAVSMLALARSRR